jgi:eukaryotic-like serine/threonine-protein kinase
MAECIECGGKVATGEHFCGNCGTQQPVFTINPDDMSATLDTESPDAEPLSAAAVAPAPEPEITGKAPETSVVDVEDLSPYAQTDESMVPVESPEPVVVEEVRPPLSSSSLGGSSTGDVKPVGTSAAPHKGTTGGHRPAIKQLDSGTVLNSRYEIVRRIGGGGMGAVYLAKDRNLGDAPRAVKEMVESHLDPAQHEKAIGDFKRESLLLTALEHPCIPTIYDYFYDEPLSRFYLVMKYISGGDLASRMRAAIGGRIDEKTVADWGMQVADVLDYLHSRPKPIIYRDLKPANLMIDGNTGRVMLIDFGIARWVSQQEKGVTAVGTMGYAPPELFSGRVQPASDVYSLGATMFHLLTGSDPQDNPLLIFDFSKNPRPRQISPSISTEMEEILMKTVEYKPEDRFRTAGDLRNALAQHLDNLFTGRVRYGLPTPQLGSETVQVQTVYCGFCGGRIAADDVFCAHCGARQPLASVSAMLHTARPTAKLVVAGTTELDASFILQKESNLLGRTDPHSNIFPEIDLSRFDPETKVSRRHARIWLEGETFLVEDLGSVNGTVINDSVRLAPRQPRVLDSGDKLRVGETILHFLVG